MSEATGRLRDMDTWSEEVMAAMLDVIAEAEVARFGLLPTDPHRRDLEDALAWLQETAS
jgi:hypothetical protein